MIAQELKDLGFEDTDELERAASEMLDSLCNTRYAAGDLVAQALAKSYISTISSNSVGGAGEYWYGPSRLETFCDDLLLMLREENIPEDRFAAAFAASIADNAYRQAVADIEWSYEHFAKNIREDMQVGDFCPGVDVASYGRKQSAIRH